jgi:two-component system chemotaxis response regulator CheB
MFDVPPPPLLPSDHRMTNRRVVIGASAGGVEALKELVSRLPADFTGSLFVVLHIGANRSNLPGILSSAGFLPAVHPTDSEQIKPGTIYVAPPDQHMLLLDTDRIRLSRGPRALDQASPASSCPETWTTAFWG